MMTWLKALQHALLGTPEPAPQFLACEPAQQPWVVVDCETSGFDDKKDGLLSIAAVKLRGEHILLGDSFHELLRPDAVSSTQNVLVHGIGHGQQSAARAPAEVLTAFRDFVGQAPMIGFHAGFDARFLRAAFAKEKVAGWQPLVLDCAVLLPLLTGQAHPPRDLDGWLQHYEITPLARHDALSDVWCTAQLWQILLRLGAQKNCLRVADWQAKLKQARALELSRL